MEVSGQIGPFDLVIMGGGPSGLLLSSLLSPEFSVAVLEERRIGATQKYWVTSRRRLTHHGLQGCVRASCPSAVFGTFLGSSILVSGDFVVTEEDQVLATLAERASSRGVTILEESPVTALRWHKDMIIVATPSGPIECSILVDASGGASPIAATFRLHSVYGFYTVYGQHLTQVALHSDALVAGLVAELSYPPVIFEVMPAPPASVICSAFVVSRRACHSKDLQPALERFTKNNGFFTLSERTSLKREFFGAIPIGRLRLRRLPGLLPFGEAGMMQSPLLGGAFNEVLMHVDTFAERLRKVLRGECAKSCMRVPYGARKRVNDWLQLTLARVLVDTTVIGLQRLVEGLDRIGSDRAYRFLAGELAASEIPLVALAALLPAQAISKPCRRS